MKRQPNAIISASSSTDSTPIAGVGNSVFRTSAPMAIRWNGGVRASISACRTKCEVMSLRWSRDGAARIRRP